MIPILPSKGDAVLIQGITGRQASFWTSKMMSVGTAITAGVSPGRGGSEIDGVPVYDSVNAAAREQFLETSVLFTPPFATYSAAIEAMEAGISRLVLLTEHVPRHDALRIFEQARLRECRVVGPNTAGLVVPGEYSLGIMPGTSTSIFRQGDIAVVSRSGSLGCLVCLELVRAGFGQSAFIGIGGDPIVGTTTREVLEELASRANSKAIVLVGEIGGMLEEDAADVIPRLGVPVIALIVGKSAPPERRMGHAGAIVTRGSGSVKGKVEALRQHGAEIAETPSAVPKLLAACIPNVSLD